MVRTSVSAQARRTGITFNRETGQLFTVRGGRIVRYEDYGSLDEALQAVELSP